MLTVGIAVLSAIVIGVSMHGVVSKARKSVNSNRAASVTNMEEIPVRQNQGNLINEQLYNHHITPLNHIKSNENTENRTR